MNTRISLIIAALFLVSFSSIFAQPYTITSTIFPDGSGNITGIEENYTSGSTASITAVPASGYRFVSWSGASTSTNATINLTMDSDKSVTANFELITYNLTTSVNPPSGGSITGVTNGGVYTSGSTASITAVPASGYRFVSWSGASTSTNATINLTMDSDKSVTANFELITYNLTTSVNPPSGGSITGVTNGGVYTSGSTASITAVPASGYRFVSWSGASTSTNATINLTMDSDKSVTANFELITYNLTTSVNPPSGGSITGVTNGGVYTSGSTASITAVPASGYRFVSWSGASTSTNATINLTMDSDKSVTANFELITYNLTTSVNPPSGGSITGVTNGGVYTSGSTASITAVPASGYRFVSWSGASTSTNATINLTMDSDKSVTANFELITYNLTTSVNPPAEEV